MSGPDVWGPHGWKFLHYVTLGYPDKPTKQDKNKYKIFLLSIGDVLPCVLCRMNYIEHLKIYPITNNVLKNRENLMAWGIKMHNLVNISNNKKEYSIEEGINMIKSDDDTCVIDNKVKEYNEKGNWNTVINISGVIIFGIILFCQFMKIYYLKSKK